MAGPVRQVTVIGHSLGVTLPRELLEIYGLHKGSLVELCPEEEGILVRPVRVISALSPAGRALAQDLIRRYRRVLDALARGETTVD
jgi:antitoxin component of MazEF toxin-antitoxin module